MRKANRITYTSETESIDWSLFLPWKIFRNLIAYRDLIVTVTMRDFRAVYQGSYFGLAWQMLLPLIMLGIFYFIFGRVMGGRFSTGITETPLDYALALFVGLGFFNFMSQCISQSASLISSNISYVKTMAFPIEILPVTAVLNLLLNLIIVLAISMFVVCIRPGGIHLSSICVIYYVVCAGVMAIGISWILSVVGAYVRDLTVVTQPLMLILMLLCPIFYPASMVPAKLRWVIELNPLAVIMENARGALLYGVWPSLHADASILFISGTLFSIGYVFFMQTKPYFSDVI
ncbi:MAG: sugar transporter permease [Rhodocyclales bacterium]|nr:sugar transporter permease [Rhodocyclales bacterium]